MAKEHTQTSSPFEQVSLDDLRRGRRGKHHTMIEKILEDLETLPSNSAIKIHLAEAEDVNVSRLRSAVNRATRSRKIPVSTHFDGDFFYVWKSPTASGKRKN